MLSTTLLQHNRIQQLMTPPIFPDEADKTRIARILHYIILMYFAVILLNVIFSLTMIDQKVGSVVIALLNLGANYVAYDLSQRGKVYLAARWLILYSWIISAIFVFLSGGLTTSASSLFIPIIAMAALLLGWQECLLMTVATLSYLLILLVAENTGHPPLEFFYLDGLASWIVLLFSAILLLIPLITMQQELIRALSNAHQQLTERQKVEAILRENEERFRLISAATSDYTFSSRFNMQNTLDTTLLSGAFETITGYTPEEFISIGGWRATLHPDDVAQDERDLATLQQNQPVISEVRLIKKDGQTQWVRVYANPIWDAEQNQLIGINGAVQDITERKLAEQALRESEARLRALLDASADVAFLMSIDGTFLTLNETIAQSIGKTVPELIGQNGFELLVPQSRIERQKWFDKVVQTRQPVRWEDSISNSWWDNSIYPILSTSGDVKAFAIHSRNVTEEKRLTAELQRYAAQLEQMVEERTAQLRHAKEQIEIILNNSRDGVALAHPNGDIQASNPAFLELFGAQSSDCIEQILKAVAADEQVISVGNTLMTVIYDQERQQTEVQIISADGKEKDLDLAFIPVRLTDNAEQNGILVSAHNITHLKEMQRFKSRFVDDALHDLATPISGLSTRLYLLKRSPEKLNDHLQALENQVDHLRNLLVDLRTLSHLDRQQLSLNVKPSNLKQLVRRVFDTYEPVAISKDQSLRIIIDPAIPEMVIDNAQMERVFVNLVSNAINYTPNGKTIFVRAYAEGDHAIFSVIDEGMGIAPEDLPHIFERFYRTQEARRTQTSGTGLGLCIVKEIVELHGGTISVISEMQLGSTFTVRLPLKT